MSSFKEMDQDVLRKILEGQENELAPLIKKEEAFFRNTMCPSCRSYDHLAIINTDRPFSPGSPLPNKILRCLSCSSEYDPYTGVILKVVTGESD